jgi:hypothetical protein
MRMPREGVALPGSQGRPRRRSRIRWVRVAVAFSVIVPATGCYHYTRVPVERVSEGQEVRVLLSESGVRELETLLLDHVRTMDRTLIGDVLEVGPDRLLLAVPTAPQGGGLLERSRTLYQRTAVSRENMLDVELRQLDRGRTGLVAGGAAALFAGFLVYRFSGWFGGTTVAQFPDGEPVEMRSLPRFQPHGGLSIDVVWRWLAGT